MYLHLGYGDFSDDSNIIASGTYEGNDTSNWYVTNDVIIDDETIFFVCHIPVMGKNKNKTKSRLPNYAILLEPWFNFTVPNPTNAEFQLYVNEHFLGKQFNIQTNLLNNEFKFFMIFTDNITPELTDILDLANDATGQSSLIRLISNTHTDMTGRTHDLD
jgi:hypothetical protein